MKGRIHEKKGADQEKDQVIQKIGLKSFPDKDQFPKRIKSKNQGPKINKKTNETGKWYKKDQNLVKDKTGQKIIRRKSLKKKNRKKMNPNKKKVKQKKF